MSGPWQNFFLDFAIVAAWVSQGFLHTGNFRDWRMAAIGVAYWLSAIAVIGIMAGDFALALGYTAQDHWFLDRQYRVIYWRYPMVAGQVVVAMFYRFSEWAR